MSGAYRIYTLDRRPDLEPERERINETAWPPFMLHGDVGQWSALFSVFARYQLLVCDPAGVLVAFGHCVPLAWDGTVADLPATIAEILARAIAGQASGLAPDTFSALAAVVAPEQQGRGLSSLVIQAMRALAAHHGCRSLIAPVRPSWKSRYPLIPMPGYAAWTRRDGYPFDPWLRVHARLGATQLAIAPSTLTVTGTVADWEAWTGMEFPGSGQHIVPGALQPVTIDCARDEGRYDDPNVWMRHAVAAQAADEVAIND